MIFHGHSYERLYSHIYVYTPYEWLDGSETNLMKFVYLENYDRSKGYDGKSSIPNAERTICDFLMYPDKLNADLWICDEIRGYLEDHEDITPIYEMLDYFKIPHSEFEKYLDVCLDGD